MNNYELTVIMKSLSDDERKTELEKVKGFITTKGGNVTEVVEAGKRELAYEINKTKDGYYYFIKFESDPKAISTIETNCKITETLIRCMVIRR